MHIALAYTAVT